MLSGLLTCFALDPQTQSINDRTDPVLRSKSGQPPTELRLRLPTYGGSTQKGGDGASFAEGAPNRLAEGG